MDPEEQVAEILESADNREIKTTGAANGAAGRLFSNSAAMAITNLAGRGIGYAYFILMARRLPVSYLGAYAILVSASMMIELVSNLGLDKILIREIARSGGTAGQGYFRAALPIRLTAGAVSAAAAWILLRVFFKNLPVGPLSTALYLCGIFPIVTARNCEAFLTAHERLLPIAASQLLERAFILGGVVLLSFGYLSFSDLVRIAPLASVARLLVVGRSTLRLWGRQAVSVLPHMGRLLRQALELFSVEVLALIYGRSDMFLLARMGGLGDAGIYQICYKVFDLCVSLFTGFLQAVFPRMVRDSSRRSLRTILALGAAAVAIPAGAIVLWRRPLLGAVHPEYLRGSTALMWLMLTVPLVYVTSTLANAAIVAGRVRIMIGLAGLLLTANVGLNLALIPRYAIDGAAFSTFACELASVLLLGPIVWKSLSQTAD